MAGHESLTFAISSGSEIKKVTLPQQVIDDFLPNMSDQARVERGVNWIINELRETYKRRQATDEMATAYIEKYVQRAD